jgi:4-hydroxythreonine-4-phosphate dehydrogenase
MEAETTRYAIEIPRLGSEERKAIVPGIRAARRKLRRSGARVELIGAETAYRLAARGQFDGVVAMYHDQATIPTKLVAFGDAVNVTMGLGYTRTSVDHGTAYDIAWQGVADSAGLRAAMQLAARMRAGSAARTG